MVDLQNLMCTEVVCCTQQYAALYYCVAQCKNVGYGKRTNFAFEEAIRLADGTQGVPS